MLTEEKKKSVLGKKKKDRSWHEGIFNKRNTKWTGEQVEIS